MPTVLPRLLKMAPDPLHRAVLGRRIGAAALTLAVATGAVAIRAPAKAAALITMLDHVPGAPPLSGLAIAGGAGGLAWLIAQLAPLCASARRDAANDNWPSLAYPAHGSWPQFISE